MAKEASKKEESTIFNPFEFVYAPPSTFTLAGALFTRLNAEIEDAERDHLRSIIHDLRQGKLNPLAPPSHLYDYLIEILQFYDDKTMAIVDLENDIDVEVSVAVLMPYRALRSHYCKLKNGE
jgi:hypothetical protein